MALRSKSRLKYCYYSSIVGAQDGDGRWNIENNYKRDRVLQCMRTELTRHVAGLLSINMRALCGSFVVGCLLHEEYVFLCECANTMSLYS